MNSEWDEAKRQSNLHKHGIDFVDAARIFDGPFVETEDLRRDYGERRYQAFGGTRWPGNSGHLHMAQRSPQNHYRPEGKKR
jgi:uncharacterized DUF497 family protein